MRGGRGFAGARIREPRPRRLDRLAEQPVALRELHLLPAPQLLAQPLVAPRLRRLPLQRAALLLDLEDDVVDAREVLLRRFELQLRGAAAALVLGDAGRLFDQLPPVGRPRAEDLADLPLLDDRVGLDAQPGVHQQVLHVAQPAGLAVDQVFALAGAIEPAHQLDVAHDQRRLVLDRRPRRPPMQTAFHVDRVARQNRRHRNAARRRPGTRAATPPSCSRTSAAPVGLRASLPPKITSSIRSPRRLLALCSPSTQVSASTTLLLPQPLGPTMAVTPWSKVSSDGRESS